MQPTHALFIVCLLGTTASFGCSEGASSSPAPVEPARVSVHEWGLVAHHYRQSPTEMAEIVSGGARYAHASPVGAWNDSWGGPSGGKPVIYVHTSAETELSIRVRAPGGTIVEHLPPGSRATPQAIAWNGLVASPTTCPTSTRVTPEHRACDTVDDYCEALENPEYDTTDAACLTSAGGARDNHLFYRAGVQVGGLPLVVTDPDPNNPGWDARNASTTAIGGKLVVVWRLGGDAPPKVALVDPPAPGATIALPSDGPVLAPAECTATLRRMLVDAGLTTQETEAFLRAWDTSIFGYIERPGDLPAYQTPPAALRQTPIALYYLAPREALERTLPLEVTPPPAELVRAMLVKVDLFDPPTGTIGLGTLGTIGHGTTRHPE